MVESEPDSICALPLRLVRAVRKPRPSRAVWNGAGNLAAPRMLVRVAENASISGEGSSDSNGYRRFIRWLHGNWWLRSFVKRAPATVKGYSMTEEIDVEPWLAIRRDVHRHKRDQSTMGWKQLAAGNTVFTMRARLEEVIHGHP